MASLKLILFDIDGTLIDTGGAGARSWTWALSTRSISRASTSASTRAPA